MFNLMKCALPGLIALVIIGGSAQAQDSKKSPCAGRKLIGSFAFKYAGTLYGPAGTLPNGDGAAVAGVGIVDFDGSGKVTFSGLNNYGGLNVPFPANTVGEYTFKADCSGTIKVTLPPEVHDEIYFVVADHGARLFGLFAVPKKFGEGSVVTLDFARL